jgi:hypothetical protein
MLAAARDTAPEEQRGNFFGALHWIRERAREEGVQACVLLCTERFTNSFLDSFPQICVGIGERNRGPTQAWRPVDVSWLGGHPDLGRHVVRCALDAGFDPAFSHLLELDQDAMTVFHELDPDLELPMVPILLNCAVEPRMPVWRAYAFGRVVGAAVRSFDALDRVAVLGTGGLSYSIGTPRVGDIAEDFDRWFLDRLATGDLTPVLDLGDDELELAGNGAGDIRNWLAVAGAVAPARARTLSYASVHPWITGMAVTHFERVR